jgi:hypothetical protein
LKCAADAVANRIAAAIEGKGIRDADTACLGGAVPLLTRIGMWPPAKLVWMDYSDGGRIFLAARWI